MFVVLFFLTLSLTAAHAGSTPETAGAGAGSPAERQETTFPIRRFVIYGNTVFPSDELKKLVDDFRGQEQTSADVEKARDRIERFYHENGYPTTLVNIPEQPVEGGFIYLQVIEGKVGSLSVKGNSWVSEKRIREEVSSMANGEVLSLPRIKKELTAANNIPDVKVTPALSPGKEIGRTDVELKVEDQIPFHGSLEVNNRNSLNTSDLRLNAMLRYDDLWSRGHAISFQYQTSPREPSEVQVFSGSYTLPVPWSEKDRLVLYGVRSDSETGFGEGFKTLGNGSIAGLRYLMPLLPFRKYYHNLTLGFDYKDFREAQTLSTEVTYLPFSVAYAASVADSRGVTNFNAGLNFVFRGLVTDIREFEEKRTQATGNYVYFTPSVERIQKLPAGLTLRLKADGQISDQPLISNEQYAAGGMESVRGYYESEISGDDALHVSVEFVAPDLARMAGFGGGEVNPYLFYDYACVKVKKPQPEQIAAFNIQGTGAGVRGRLFSFLEYEVDGAWALRDAGSAEGGARKGDARVMFRVKGQF